MDFNREFLRELRKVELSGEAHITISDDISPALKKYIKTLYDIRFVDGSYHTYYGDIKRAVISFVTYWDDTIDKTIVQADNYRNTSDRETLLMLMERTIEIHHTKQINFGKEYLPVRNANEKAVYEDIERQYNDLTVKLFNLRSQIGRLDKKEKVEEFRQSHFDLCLNKKKDLFEFTHMFIALTLADYVSLCTFLFHLARDFWRDLSKKDTHNIKVSVEEICLRMRNNLAALRGCCSDDYSRLLGDLYERNKELLHVRRREKRQTVEMAELTLAIESLKEKIKDFEEYAPIQKLEIEVKFWEGKIKEFNEIVDILNKLKAERDEIVKQEEQMKSMSCTELAGPKQTCWHNIIQNIKERKAMIKEKIIENAKALVTFFSVRRALARMTYGPDEIGVYCQDEFGHQVYISETGLTLYHMNCEGALYTVKGARKYLYDAVGRYWVDELGAKVYQSGACTSQYALGEDALLRRSTRDCGHSDAHNSRCMMAFRDRTQRELLPPTEPVHIKETLDAETVKYLWDSFGSILHDALHDVALAESNNPIHYLAHRLLYHKYSRTLSEMRKKKKEAQDYRDGIYKQREEAAVAASRAWRAKQVPRRKPEESDDAGDWAAYSAHADRHKFITSLDYYN